MKILNYGYNSNVIALYEYTAFHSQMMYKSIKKLNGILRNI